MNHVILVGRLTDNPDFQESSDSRMVITVAVPRTFKNSEGLYETDFLRCVLWNGIAKKTKEYSKKGDTICVRGRLQVRTYENEEKEKKYMTEIIAESIAFVASKKENNMKNINQENDDEDI